jgi:anti-sigma regulatory factor (Ser/Thr protein kinase)
VSERARTGPPEYGTGKLLSEPPAEAEVLEYRADLTKVREFTAGRARRAGLPPDRVTDLVIAVNELAANTLTHTSGPGTLLLWVTADEVVCQIHDSGRFTGPPLDSARPAPDDPGGRRGLWVVRQVCDQLEICTGEDGTTSRVHMRLRL